MNQANSVPAFLTLRVLQEKLRMQKGTCHGLHRKFFRSRVLHLPGNNYAWACAKSLQSCPTLRPYVLKPARLLCPQDSPGKNTWVGCHVLLQGIFLTQGLDPCFLHLLHWQLGSLPLVPPGNNYRFLELEPHLQDLNLGSCRRMTSKGHSLGPWKYLLNWVQLNLGK